MTRVPPWSSQHRRNNLQELQPLLHCSARCWNETSMIAFGRCNKLGDYLVHAKLKPSQQGQNTRRIVQCGKSYHRGFRYCIPPPWMVFQLKPPSHFEIQFSFLLSLKKFGFWDPPPPHRISSDHPSGGYGYFLEPHNGRCNVCNFLCPEDISLLV